MDILRRYIGFIILILVGSIPLLPLFHPGLPITHDGQDHVARIANFYASLSEGNIIPRWAGNLNWGYGHPILMFLYPLPSYLTSIIHFLGFSLVDSVKIIFGLSFVASGITMYLFLRNVVKNNAAILGAILYMYAPYRFVDLYVRGAIGEHVAFIFIPLVLYFLLKMSKKISYKFIAGGAFSLAGLFLSHNAISLMFLPFYFIFAVILIFKSKQKKLLTIHYSLFTILGFGLSSFFLLPAFLEGKYTLRDIVTGHGEYRQGFISLKDFFVPSWSFGGTMFLSKQIGIVQLIALFVSIIALWKVKSKKFVSLFFLSLSFLLFSLFLMHPVSDFIWKNISFIQKFQFPWRLLAIVVVATSIIAAFSVQIFSSKKAQKIFIAILITLSIVLYYPYYQAQGYLIKPQIFYTGIYKSTTDTGESSPIWSVRFMENIAPNKSDFIDGEGKITEVSRNSTERNYNIEVRSSTARIRENTLYFPNWEVYVNGQKKVIEFQDKMNRGLITYYLKKGENNVNIKFIDTKVRMISNWITLLSAASIFVLFFFRKKLR